MTDIKENPVDEVQEIVIQEAPNKEFSTRLDKFYIEYIREKAEVGEYHLEDVGQFLEFINRKLGNPKGL